MPGLTGRRARAALGERLRDPLGLVRATLARGTVNLLLLAALLPAGLRGHIARPFAAGLTRAARRRRGVTILSEVAFVASWAGESAEAAAAFASRQGTGTETAPSARRRLAVLARAAGLTSTASEIAASMPDDEAPDLELVRARTAYDEGRYSDALEHARRADSAGAYGAAEVAALAAAQLTVLQPGWRPDVAPVAERLAALRGRAVRGRVMHLVATSLPYREAGFTIRTQAVARCQAEVGLSPHVVTRAGFPRTEGIRGAPAAELVAGIPHHHLEPDYPDATRFDRLLDESAQALVAVLEAVRPAVLQPASNHLQAQVALAVGRPLGIPVVYEVRGFWEESWAARPNQPEAAALASEHYRLTRAVETAAMLEADAIVTLAETMRQDIIARGADPANVVVVPNAVDIERFQPRPRDPVLAAGLGIGPDETVIGYISSFSPYEGIPCLVEATARLRDEGRRVRLLLVGDGPGEDAIRATARRTGLDDGTLVMPGRVPFEDVIRYHALIDVFVVPRTADRVSGLVTPLKPFEAMAMGRAIVVSDLPALREIVTPGETGATFRAEDAEDLAAVVGGLLEDERARERLGRQAREWVVAERTWAANGRRYRELFERLGAA